MTGDGGGPPGRSNTAVQGQLFSLASEPAPGSPAGAGTQQGKSSGVAPAPRAGPPRVVLIDGHGLAYRSYHAISDLTTSSGVPVNAVYGFARALLDTLAKASPGDAVVVAFDTPKPTFRHERFEAYKAQRPPAPPDLPKQLDTIRRLVELLGVASLRVDGYEADDLIGTVARQCEAQGLEVEIITADRDALQLVSEHVYVVSPDGAKRVGPAEVLSRYGVRADQWVDYRALTGDSSDNIPGVRGIGPVAAKSLLNRYGSLDEILRRLNEVEPASQAARIRDSLADLELSRELSLIVTDAPIEVDLEAWRQRQVDEEALSALLRELEFGSLLHQLGLAKRVSYQPSPLSELLAAAARRALTVAFGYVLDGERPIEAEVSDLAVAAGGQVANVGPAERDRTLAGPITACGAKALVVAARKDGGRTDAVPGHDPLLMAYLIDSIGSRPETLARRLGAGEWGPDAASRAVATAELYRLVDERLTGEQRRLYLELEQPLQAVLADMELAGVRLDTALLEAQSRELGERAEQLEARLKLVADNPAFNVNSRDQVAWLLYDRLRLKTGRRTSTGKQSTAVGSLEPLRGSHEAVDLILQQRETTKLKSTYVDPLLKLVCRQTGRLHTTFHQAAVSTGRLASSDPNLQSVPVRSAAGREVRRAFIAAEGCVLLVADYSQIELRVLAHIADEPALQEAFARGEDIHRSTAARVFGVAPAAVDGEMRRAAKIINFGVLYGMSAQRLSRELSVPYPQAEEFITTYFQRYPNVRKYIDDTLASGRELGYVRTLLGRRRAVPELRSANRERREAVEREAYNMPIQGSAADIMKLAMLRLAPALQGVGGRLLLQIHDEIVAEVPKGEAAAAKQLVGEAMSQAYVLKVPLVAEVGIGDNWLDAK